MILTWNNFKYTKVLDYYNTTFRCRIYHILGHLQATCPHAHGHPLRKKGTKSKPKRWTFSEESILDINLDQNEVN